MRALRSFALVGLLVASACGTSTPAATETVPSTEPAADQTLPEPEPANTLPGLVSAETDIDAIDMPVVLWFWSPG